MFKKFLAGLTVIALSLGMVALTAGPASAHSNNISASVACNTGPDGFWKVTWTIENDHGTDATINTSTRTAVTAGTVVPANSSVQFVEYFTSQPTNHVTLEINSTWAGDDYTRDNDLTINKKDFKDNCVPDDTDKKVDVCHWDNGQSGGQSGKYTLNDISVNAVLNGSSHASNSGTHGQDIIPPFDYIKNGVPGHYDGKNWTAYGQAVYAAGCDFPSATPAAPTFTEAVCTAPGQLGQASYVIPSTAGVKYTVRINGAGGFVEMPANTYYVAAGTKVEVKAVALAGYTLQGTTEWSRTFLVIDCTVTVTPAVPTFTSAVCLTSDPGTYGKASYTIPATAGVQYQVRFSVNGSWTDKAAGTYDVSAGAYVQIRALPLTGYMLSGTQKWTMDFTAPDCLTDAVPTKPTKTEAVCTAEEQVGPASFTIPSITGIKYQQLIDFNWVDVAPGSHPAVDGELVTVRAVPLAGYELTDHDWFSGNKTYFLLFDNLNASKDCIVPVAPTFDPQVCDVPGQPSQASFTIPSDTGVKYQAWDGDSWETIAAGTYDVNSFPADVKIRAVPKSGYAFLDGATTEWESTFTADFCPPTLPVVDPVVTFTQTTCSAPGTYTLAVDPDTLPDGVIWTVSGGLPNTLGSHTVSTAGTVTITATPAPGYGFATVTLPAEWSFDFATLPDDCLPTLAFTGGGLVSGGLGLAGLLTLGGVLLIAARRRETASASE